MQYALYTHWSDSGECLYIGISKVIGSRTRSHELSSRWWSEVARIDITRYATQHEASQAEIAAIAKWSPKYNRNKPNSDTRKKNDSGSFAGHSKQLASMKAGESFLVNTEYERQQIVRVAKAMNQAGLVNFEVVTRKEGNQFKVAAI